MEAFAAEGPGPVELPLSSLVDSISAWVETLHGSGSCADGLARIARLVGARSISLVRIDPQDRTTLGTCASNGNAAPGNNILSVALMDSVGFAHLKVGQIHWASDLLADETFDRRWTTDRRFRSAALAAAAVLVLERRPTGLTDVAEIQYTAAPNGAQRRALDAIAPIVARRWVNRQPGLAHRLLRPSQPEEVPMSRPGGTSALLDAANPAGLTRAEFRLCMLIRNGVNMDNLAKTAGIRPSTAKAHLRSIYDKTGCRNRTSLVQTLMSQQFSQLVVPVHGPAERAGDTRHRVGAPSQKIGA